MKYNPALLKLDLFCRGINIDKSCDLEKDARPVLRTRGGLGSGLELLLDKNIYVNIPIYEKFVKNSVYALIKKAGEYYITDNNSLICRVNLPPRPDFYNKRTSSHLSGNISWRIMRFLENEAPL